MERKIGDIKDKKLKIENITLAAIYNILFTNDIVCSLIVEMLSALRKSELCRFRIKQQGNKLEYLARQYEKKINKIAGHRAFSWLMLTSILQMKYNLICLKWNTPLNWNLTNAGLKTVPYLPK